MIKFTVYGIPEGKGRPRFTRTGQIYTPNKTAAYEKSVRGAWKEQVGITFPENTCLRMSLVAYFPIPASYSKKKAAAMDGKFHLKKPDADNIAKIIGDALNGIAYKDDSVVQIDKAWKIYTNAAPRVEVEITVAEEGCP